MAKSTSTLDGFNYTEKATLFFTATFIALALVMLTIAGIQSGDLGAQLVAGFGIAVFAFAGAQLLPSKAERLARKASN